MLSSDRSAYQPTLRMIGHISSMHPLEYVGVNRTPRRKRTPGLLQLRRVYDYVSARVSDDLMSQEVR
jgi:hypothetical protein